ncbi:hypothetical protein Y032_0035g3111 [Ancylostoma ceylanicum]|uniref:Uncharacterized protein n=1 Tax=Ancylostoma ceylanicum TaxID=53326 RepID=A0A016ULL3_9BILA|nr:hypothetical protein Y032_0035g3111 [Ancylostoma ceylanicum]
MYAERCSIIQHFSRFKRATTVAFDSLLYENTLSTVSFIDYWLVTIQNVNYVSFSITIQLHQNFQPFAFLRDANGRLILAISGDTSLELV